MKIIRAAGRHKVGQTGFWLFPVHSNYCGRCILSTLIAVMILSGCASITGSVSQNVSVQAMERSGFEVRGADCELANDKGKWFITTPGSVGIQRSNENLLVLCRKDGFRLGRATVVSDIKGMMFGNILIGGAVGAVIDHFDGAGYEYPALIQVMMSVNPSLGTSQLLSNDESITPSNARKSENAVQNSPESRINQDVQQFRQEPSVANTGRQAEPVADGDKGNVAIVNQSMPSEKLQATKIHEKSSLTPQAGKSVLICQNQICGLSTPTTR